MKPLGIKVKVALATSITSVVVVGLVTAMQMRKLEQDFTRVLFAQQTALINRTAEELDDKLNMLLGIIAMSAKMQPPSLVRDPAALRAYYADRAVLSLFDDILVLDPKGQIIADLPEVAGRTQINAGDRAFFKKVLATHQPLIAEPVIGKSGKQPIVQMAAPVLDNKGEVQAVLVGVLRLYKENVLGHLRNAKVGRTGYYFAVTRSDAPLYVLHPDLERMLKPRPPNADSATTRALNEGFEGTAIGTGSNGIHAFSSFKALKSVDWVLAASLPVEEAFEPFEGMRSRVATWGILASLAAAALIGWLTTRLMAPLARLQDAIQRMQAGRRQDTFTPIAVSANDEIGEVTQAFNSLMRQREAADRRLHDMIDLAPNAIVVTDADGRIETFNREAERCFGYARDDILGRPVEMLIPPDQRDAHQQLRQGFASTRLSPEPVRMGSGRTLQGLRKDGSRFPADISLSAISTADGLKVLAVITDITQRERLRQESEARAAELEQSRDRAEAANRAKSDFVANMSHEIRTPMNAVLGMAHLLGNTPLTAQQRKYLNMVQASGQTLLAILNDVLDFSKIEARRMELAPVDFDLDDTVNSLATTMTMNAGEKELELAIAVAPDVPRQLHGDALRLQQILVNLAGNAIKFTEQGEVVVRVALASRDGATAMLRFEVADTGIGISEAQQAQLFNAFTQGDESITRRFGGTGLGLAITKKLIELMGGDIAVDSAEGKGSRFWFTLPFAVVADAAKEVRQPGPGKQRVLVADDNATSRELVCQLIRAWGWEVEQAPSFDAALERLPAQPHCNVLLADWHMPGMDAPDALRKVRRVAADLPVVTMLNAFARDRIDAAATSGRQLQPDAVLVKPVTASSLYDALHQALQTKAGGNDGAAKPSAIAGRLRGVHFLLVEDNLLNQAVARGILEHAGATVDTVGDGQQAVDLLRTDAGRYDVVLMDMQMPVLDGFSATAILRRELKLTLPVIAMTAGVLASERDRCVEAGISDFIAKPVVVEDMLAVIGRHLPSASGALLANGAPAPGVAQSAALAAPTAAPAPALAHQELEPLFNMSGLMKVMGKDPKGRAVMFRMVRGAVSSGMKPADDADLALKEDRPEDAARILHSLRGAIGVLGAKRLIRATLEAEHAITEQRRDEWPAHFAEVRTVLAATLQEAEEWLEREENATT
ncbi:hypothetical protein GCM10027277_28360 [Pseudoduganella ginsengisoli]|uniref:Sensory/regulatory protein RpfC n=1 Tax=Pseudoduganella ginsengisoli TaxID=1462440 RepID=A0A6L6PZF1_9BURK|nr:response regulator [Pseudoduganella ginsengisoli]MTW02937.1 response regulator [Pseudoduganella ginsengisoli]